MGKRTKRQKNVGIEGASKSLAVKRILDLVPLDHMELKERVIPEEMCGYVDRREGVVKTIGTVSVIGLIGRCLQVVEKMVVERIQIQKTIGAEWRMDRLSSATLCLMERIGLWMRSVGMYKAWVSWLCCNDQELRRCWTRWFCGCEVQACTRQGQRGMTMPRSFKARELCWAK